MWNITYSERMICAQIQCNSVSINFKNTQCNFYLKCRNKFCTQIYRILIRNSQKITKRDTEGKLYAENANCKCAKNFSYAWLDLCLLINFLMKHVLTQIYVNLISSEEVFLNFLSIYWIAVTLFPQTVWRNILISNVLCLSC